MTSPGVRGHTWTILSLLRLCVTTSTEVSPTRALCQHQTTVCITRSPWSGIFCSHFFIMVGKKQSGLRCHLLEWYILGGVIDTVWNKHFWSTVLLNKKQDVTVFFFFFRLLGCSSKAVRLLNIQMTFPNDTRWHTSQAIQDLSFFLFFYKDAFCVCERKLDERIGKKKNLV